ncbi:MAG: HAD family hydrolase [Paludibacteraceae bacterium]|nr:HAD family hydrolase [Paludibacteraceae bacterium]
MTIIFDLDGTLLNTIDDLGYACNYALRQSGYSTHPISAYPKMVGNGINNLIRRALPPTEQTEEKILRVREWFVPYYNSHNTDYTRPYEGITDLLQDLHQKGHHLAVASNKYQAATEKIVQHFFPTLFDIVLGEREGVERKPNPQIVYDILTAVKCRNDDYHATNTDKSDILYIGDSLVDWQTAKNANVPFVACSWGFVPKEELLSAGITNIADKAQDLLAFI